MILTAYIDESGTHDESPVTVMAGYLPSAQRRAAFNAEWATFLAILVDHFQHYSMGKSPSIFFRGRGASKLLKKPRRSPCNPRKTLAELKEATSN
jgi:hypothetical protein